jgi:membrane-associated PAP2 superfamily phosphatase
LDIQLQNYFYNFSTNTWLISEAMHSKLTYIFYVGIKAILAILGLISLIILARSTKNKKFKKWQKASLLMLLSLSIVPVITGQIKAHSNIYCPMQLEMYGGKYPHAQIFEPYSQEFIASNPRVGRCFPAGHASGGFALMMLFFCFKKRNSKIKGLALGLSLGWIMGIYQILRGEHFLSHTIVSMLLAWVLILIIQKIVSHYQN